MRIFKTKRSFKKEFKRQIKWAIAAAVGFTIAYAWRDAVIVLTKDIVTRIAESTRAGLTSIYSALLITLIGVLIILASSRLLRDK
ncbi:hypothetical protein FJZ17_02785 [Candidatus Pacearchaeota archaeon]|nr:hypothetical protein [Candidatus Pacearchaeota archaeon]